jgi:hypothetical protein
MGHCDLPFWGRLGRVTEPASRSLRRARCSFRYLPRFRMGGVQNDRMVRVVNTGRSVVIFHGYNPAAPWYTIELKRNGKWSPMPMIYTTSGGQPEPQLKPGESLEFPVVAPAGAEPWRVGLVYNELAPSNQATRLVDRALSFLHRPSRSPYKPFLVWSETVPQ